MNVATSGHSDIGGYALNINIPIRRRKTSKIWKIVGNISHGCYKDRVVDGKSVSIPV